MAPRPPASCYVRMLIATRFPEVEAWESNRQMPQIGQSYCARFSGKAQAKKERYVPAIEPATVRNRLRVDPSHRILLGAIYANCPKFNRHHLRAVMLRLHARSGMQHEPGAAPPDGFLRMALRISTRHAVPL